MLSSRWIGGLLASLVALGCGPATDPACAGITCSGRGTCAVVEGTPTCNCDPGFESIDGLRCSPPPGELEIPTAHPRLWWTEERLAGARALFASEPFTPPASVDNADRAMDVALHHLLSGPSGASSCRLAIDWALSVLVNTDGVASDIARWEGEGVIVVFDWCFDELTVTEQNTLIERWNTYIATLNDKEWGGIDYEGNNYYLGYWRNTVEWGIASYHENAAAPGFLDYALTTRWEESLRPYLDTEGRGGITQEGSAYGMRTTFYYTLPIISLALLGRDLPNETPFFRELVYWYIYATTPGPTHMLCDGTTPCDLYEVFPFNEDERWYERNLTTNRPQTSFDTYLVPLIAHWAAEPVAGYARRYLEVTGQPVEARFVSYAYPPSALAAVTSRPFDTLPLDYYAAGMGTLYTKSAWADDATAIAVQGLNQVGVGHNHNDEGSFQLWRAGQWLTRESVGYTHLIAGYGGTGEVDCANTVGHNGLLSNGAGSFGSPSWHGRSGQAIGRPAVTRLESRDDYSYMTVDLTPAYQASAEWQDRLAEIGGDRRVASMVREFLFIRPLDTLVVFDRIETASGSPAEVSKTFLLHLPTDPVLIDAATVEASAGNQVLRATTLLPAVPTRRVIVEGGTIGQYRVELEQVSAGTSYFLNVLQARDTAAANLTLALVDNGASYTLTLVHPTLGSAVVELVKGATSTGGTFGYAAGGAPSPAPLRTDVQSMSVDTSGPIWTP